MEFEEPSLPLLLLNGLIKIKEVTTSLFQEVAGKALSKFCLRKQGVSRGLRPNLLILNKGAITSLSLFKTFSSNRVLLKEVTVFKALCHTF